MCDNCDTLLDQFDQPWCIRCGVPSRYGRCYCLSTPENLERVRSIGPFDGWLRGAVIQFKFHGEWARAEHLGGPLANVISDLQPFDVLVPVPLHPSRLRHRGFNQSLLIARHAGMHLGVEAWDSLVRTRPTASQAALGFHQRLENVAGAFDTYQDIEMHGLRIVLVDDVITTGSTLSACAEALHNAGASSVRAASIAREM